MTEERSRFLLRRLDDVLAICRGNDKMTPDVATLALARLRLNEQMAWRLNVAFNAAADALEQIGLTPIEANEAPVVLARRDEAVRILEDAVAQMASDGPLAMEFAEKYGEAIQAIHIPAQQWEREQAALVNSLDPLMAVAGD